MSIFGSKWIDKFFPRPKKRKAITHVRLTCARCGREVATARDGRLFLHRCEPKAVANE